MCWLSCLPQLINAVVLLILLSALNDPVQYRYHLTSSELGTDVDVMDDASELRASVQTGTFDVLHHEQIPLLWSEQSGEGL